MNTAKWVEKGDEYYLQVEKNIEDHSLAHGFTYQWKTQEEVMRLVPALDEHFQRIGWFVLERVEVPFVDPWREVTPQVFPQLGEAKTVAMAWWRMR